MENKTLKIQYNVLKHEELDSTDKQLVDLAISATKCSYCNYSHFSVGAAVLLANGQKIIGANQENAAFPVTICAERAAIFAAQTQYPDQPILSIAIAAATEKGLLKTPITPCGSCRQVILGIEQRYNKPIRVILYGTDYIYIFKSIKDLIPFSFTDSDME